MGDFDYFREYREWKWNIPEYYNMGYDAVDKHVDDPDKKNKVALYWEHENGERRKYTFWEMSTLSNRMGNALRGLGLKKGDRFLIRLPNIPEFQIVFLAGVKIGAVPIPSSVMFKAKEVEYRINDSSSVLVVTTPEHVKEVEEVRSDCPSLEHVIVVGEPEEGQLSFYELLERSSRYLELERTRAEDMAFFCYTSGTTGMPKGAVHAHRWAIGNDPNARYWQAFRPDDIVAHTGALSWIYPLGNAFIYAWRHGASVLLYEGRFSPEKWFELIERYQVTNLACVPTGYRMFLTVKDFEKRWDLSTLRHCISAGEPLNPEVIAEWKRRLGIQIYDGIGMTECMVYLSNIPGMEIRPGSCGRPQPGHICAIVDDEGNELPQGELGTLAVRKDDPGLFLEYWNKPEKTAECFKKDWFLTGDTLFIDSDGYYWFSARGDDLIMTAGYRVSPFEVESTLIEHPAVLEAAVVSSPDKMRGVIVKAFLILNEGYEPSEELKKDIQNFMKENAAPYKYPREIEFVEQLPKTQSGKIKRKELREREWERKKVP
ncbi:acyl-CoA synthetase [Thermoplasmatales archaeon ex4484_6]|nr:MAG: acyl-CoA synthetase [Thermoplasmatales archaeon ex4484_6]RLF66550.1 MAG: acyl-CoA synthetase [Thermoplasmata archaeon]